MAYAVSIARGEYGMWYLNGTRGRYQLTPLYL